MIRIPKLIGQKNIVLVFVLLCLLCFGQFLGISALNLMLTITIVGISCFADLNDLFVIMLSTLPLYNVINYRVGTYSMHYLIVGLFIVKYLLCTKISVYKLLAFLVLFLLRVFAADFVLLVSWSLLILPLILTLDDSIWALNIRRVVFWMNLSMLLSCVIGYIMMVTHKTIYTTSYLYISGVETVRFAGLTGDSVVFGLTCVFTIAINLVYCFFNPNHKAFYIVTSIFLTIAGLLSYSKMTLMCTALIVFMFLILYGKEYAAHGRRLLYSIIFAGILIVLVLALFIFLMNYSGNSALILGYIDRFTRDDLSTGRFSLWGVYLKKLASQMRYLFVPLTSKELSTPIWNPTTGGHVAYVHNLYLETVAAFGWCTAILIFVWFLHRLYRFAMSKSKLILSLPVFVLIFMGFGSHGNFEYQFYLQLALALAFLQPEMGKMLQRIEDTSTAT
ncbi:MAG: hypothetical protein PHV18_16770 [Lachnospiraceae bacterium]|nr:hypothetical protein [Lachnospiraceae bacterium]